VTDNSLEDLFNKSVQISWNYFITTIRVSSWQCCERCIEDFQLVCSEIDNSTSLLPELILEELVNSTVFNKGFFVTDLCGEELHQCFLFFFQGQNGMGTEISLDRFEKGYQNIRSIGRSVFSVARYPQQEQTTPVQIWRRSNDSIMFCSNKSVISQLSNQAYKQIQLSANGFQVDCLLILLSRSLTIFLKCNSNNLASIIF